MAQVSRTPKDLKNDISSSKPGSISKRLLTPCRQVGLSRKRKTPCSGTVSLNNSLTSNKDNSPLTVNASGLRSTNSKNKESVNSLDTPLSAKNVSNAVKEETSETLALLEVGNNECVINTAKKARPRGKTKKPPVSRCLLPNDVNAETETCIGDKNKQDTNLGSETQAEVEHNVAMEPVKEKPEEAIEKEKKLKRSSKSKPQKQTHDIKTDQKKTIRKITSDTVTPVIQLEQLDLSDIQSNNEKLTLDLNDDDDAFTSTPDEDTFLKNTKTKKLKIDERKKRRRKVRRILSEEGSDLSGNLIKEEDQMSFETSEQPMKKRIIDSDDEFLSTPSADKTYTSEELKNIVGAKEAKKPNPDLQKIDEEKNRRRKVRRILSEEGRDLSGNVIKDDDRMSFEASEEPLKERIIDCDDEFLSSSGADKMYTPEELKNIVGAKEVEEPTNTSIKTDKPHRKSKSFKRILSMKKTNSFEEITEKSPDMTQVMIKVDYIKENIEPENESHEEKTDISKESPDKFQGYNVDSVISEDMPSASAIDLDKEEEEEEFTCTPEDNKFAKPELLRKIAEIEARIKQKKDEVAKLKQAKIYRKKHNLEELNGLYNVWKTGCKAALKDLLSRLQTSQVIDMPTLLERFQVPSDVLTVSPDGELV